MPLHQLLLLAAVGVVAGTLNVLAGGGSLLTLPVLVFFGLPAGVANGTNRIGILLQNIVASWSFRRSNVLVAGDVWWMVVPATLGAGLGTLLALEIGDQALLRLLPWLMVGVVMATLLWDPAKKNTRSTAKAGREDPRALDDTAHAGVTDSQGGASRFAVAFGFFVAGVYGGFIQAGVGFLILAVISLLGLDLVRGNAFKVVVVLAFTCLSLFLFAADGQVQLVPGLALGTGTMLGGFLGARLTVLKGHRFVRLVVVLTVIAFAARLWWSAR